MKIKTMLSVVSCRAARGLMHAAGRGGTAFPGKTAMFFDPDIARTASEGMEIIVVTGTNGKTTTCAILKKAVEYSGHRCVSNRTGANLLSGVSAELACEASLLGKPRKQYAVIECDEGALKQVVPLLDPKVIVVTNLFRDQLDRYGEVMHTRDEIIRGIRTSPESVVCLNADCSLTASIAEEVDNRIVYYGMDVPAGSQEESEDTDAKYCLRCGAQYLYRYHTYAHLGGFYCPNCGYARQETNIAVTEFDEKQEEHPYFRVRIGEEVHRVRTGLPAVYNVYNACAARSGGLALGLPKESLFTAIKMTGSAFGRMESFHLGNSLIRMILVKNPAGCDQALSYIRGTGREYDLILCLNDKTADGHDISWIWDADFESAVRDPKLKKVYVSGIRADDMQLRIKYAGLPENEVVQVTEYERLIDMLRSSDGLPRTVFILPNYTAMLDLRKVLSKAAGGKDYWENET